MTLEFFVEPLFRRRTYSRLFYLLVLAFPLGTAYFVFLVAGISTGIGLAIVWIGVPILLGMAVAWRALARMERFFAVELLGAQIDPPTPSWPRSFASDSTTTWSSPLRTPPSCAGSPPRIPPSPPACFSNRPLPGKTPASPPNTSSTG